MSKEITIELRNLAIGYPHRVVAEGLSATVYSGELTCLIGSNGVGKSTLLRTIAAFQPKLGGSILVRGGEIDSYKSTELARLISVVLTERIEVGHMTVLDLVSLGRSLYTGFWGKVDAANERKALDALRLVGMERFAPRDVGTLSDGERQKVMIAKALAQETPIILLDEPTSFLDFPSKVDMMQLLHRLSRETHKTIFLSIHDLEMALQIADKIWLLDDEKRLHIGTPEDLSLDGTLSDFFERRDIVFDRLRGLFRIENPHTRTIRISAPTHRLLPLYHMVVKALRRNAILATPEAESADAIELSDGGVLLRTADGRSHHPTTIEELLDLLTNDEHHG